MAPPPFGSPYERKLNKESEVYTVGNELGQGGFAIVKHAVCKEHGTEWALKMIKKQVYKKNKAQTDEEVKVLKEIANPTEGNPHPGVVTLREVLTTKKHFTIVLELLGGGELFDRIVEREHYGEEDAKEVTRTILETIAYLHSRGVVHRDLKPENLIFKEKGEDAQLKITDFGFAGVNPIGTRQLTQSCGTPEYVAPEILQDSPYDEKCDIWSCGVIIYILLCGFPPFYADSDEELFHKIGTASFEFMDPYWTGVSESAKVFVDRLLTVDATKRPSAAEALKDPWLTSGEKGGDLMEGKKALARFQAVRKFRKGVMAIVAGNRFKNAFEKLA